MSLRLRRSRAQDLVPGLITLAAIAAFSFLSGGYVIGRSTPVVIAWLAAAAVWVWLLRRQDPPSRLYLAALVALAALAGWTGLSVLWSFGPDLTWTSFNLTAFYLAVAAVVGLTPVRRLQLRVVAYGFVGVAGAVAVYAYAGKVVPDVVTHAHTYARLDSPVGYWNVLALMMVTGLTVVAAVASRARAHPLLRLLAAAAGVPMVFTFFFALSRGGYVALLVCLVVYFAFSTTRLASAAVLGVVVAPAAYVLWRLRDLETLYGATTDDVLRTAQGHQLLRWSVAALAITVALQLALMVAQQRVPWPRWLRIAAGVALIVVVVGGGLAGGRAYVQRQGGGEWLRSQYRDFVENSDDQGAQNTAGRLFSVNTGRPPLWREAMRQYEVLPGSGSGAGTFVFTNERFRTVKWVVKHAHNEWLNTLSGLGWPGLTVLVVAMALFVVCALRRPFRDRRDRERALLAALQAGVVAFVVHVTWDWDWDMAVAGSMFFLFAGTSAAFLATRGADLAAARRQAATTATDASHEPDDGDEAPAAVHPSAAGDLWAHFGPRPLRVLAVGLLALLALSWVPPFVSQRGNDRAVTAAGDGELTLAESEARRAARWNPLSVDPLVTLALVQQQMGKGGEALATLRQAAALQPQNPDVYYQMGLLQLRVLGRRQAAVASFRRALALDPLDDASAYELQQAVGGG